MSSLDDKLRDTLEDWYPGTQYADVIPKLKQVFADERYVTPENAAKVQEMVNSMAKLANDAFQIPTIQYIKPNKAMTKAQNLMTGQEWYDRFDKELRNLISRGDGETWMGWDCGEVREAAKKASNL